MATASKQHAIAAPNTLVVTSRAFAPGRSIPREFTGHGDDDSPPLEWHGAPEGTRAIAVVVDDPDAPGGTFTHWSVWDLPAGTTTLARGVSIGNLGGVTGQNDFGFERYMGPKPPSGTHRYHFQVFALKKKLGLPAGSTPEHVWAGLASHVLAWGEAVGTFTRP